MLSSARRAWPSLQSSSSSAGLRQFEKYFSSTFAKSPVSYKKRHKGETLIPCAADIPAWCHGAGEQTKLDHSGTFRGGLGQQRLGGSTQEGKNQEPGSSLPPTAPTAGPQLADSRAKPHQHTGFGIQDQEQPQGLIQQIQNDTEHSREGLTEGLCTGQRCRSNAGQRVTAHPVSPRLSPAEILPLAHDDKGWRRSSSAGQTLVTHGSTGSPSPARPLRLKIQHRNTRSQTPSAPHDRLGNIETEPASSWRDSATGRDNEQKEQALGFI